MKRKQDVEVKDRRASGATHSFRLHPRACEIMDNHPEIIPRSKNHNKSAWASRAIQWFFDSPLLSRERDPDTGDFTGKFVVANVGQPRPFELLLKIESLEKELEKAQTPSWRERLVTAIASKGRRQR